MAGQVRPSATPAPSARVRRQPVLGASFDRTLSGARSGQAWGYEALWRSYAPLVAGYLRVQGSDEPDATTNGVFADAFRSLDRFEGDEGGFRSWLFTIAHRRLVDERRQRARRPVTEDPMALTNRSWGAQPLAATRTAEPTPGGADEEAMARMGTERVRAILSELSPDQRDVLLLRFVSGLTLEETAIELGKSLTAIKALQRRGVNTIRRRWATSGGGVSQ